MAAQRERTGARLEQNAARRAVNDIFRAGLH
jgi:hypothetical protein